MCVFNPYVTKVYVQFYLQKAIYPLLTLSQISLFSLFIPLILKLFLLERSSRYKSLFLISIVQLGLVVWMTSMSFLRLNRFLSIVATFSFNLLNFSSVSSWVNSRFSFRSSVPLLRLSSLWFASIVFHEINFITLLSWFLNISSCFFRDSFLMLFEHILEDLLDIFNRNIGWSHDNFPWVYSWLLIWWVFDDCFLIWVI